jgi:dihydroorotase
MRVRYLLTWTKGYPSVAEEIMLSRDIMLAEYCGNHRYHASHISTKASVELIRNAKKKGIKVSCEVTPHHFSLTEDIY